MNAPSDMLAAAIDLRAEDRLQEAEEFCRRVIAAEPNNIFAWHLLGMLAHDQGNSAQAITCIKQAIAVDPNYLEANSHVATILQEAGEIEQAAYFHRRVAELAPTSAGAHFNLGNVLSQLGRLDDAIRSYASALAIDSNLANAHCNLGVALHRQGRYEDAITAITRALQISPNNAEAYNNLANALNQLGRVQEASASYRRAIELRPDFAEACHNLAVILHQQQKFDEAITRYRRCLNVNPQDRTAYTNLGNILQDLGRLEEAADCYRGLLSITPDDANIHNILGNLLRQQAHFDDAVACYRRAAQLNPALPDSHWNLATLLLLRGRFEQGWPLYEWRWKTGEVPPRHFAQPRWQGESLAGKTILIHSEQGLGDMIQFVRYAAMLHQLGARVIVECQQSLKVLLGKCAGIDGLVGEGEELPTFDVYAPLMSLPGLFKTTLQSIPANVPYVFASPVLIEHWRERLKEVSGFRIGINWHGRVGLKESKQRDVPLEFFLTLSQIPGVSLISLQKGAGQLELLKLHAQSSRASDHRSLPIDCGNIDEEHGGFMDTAAIMKNLDLVVTSDTSIAHLAGALGVSVWVALPFLADWRWLRDRSDSPWYPTMRLFRQKSRGDWAAVFEHVKNALRERTQNSQR